MNRFPSLAADAGVRHILEFNRPAGRALIAYHEAVLRQPSDLSVAERELIAAFVSGLNGCTYCYGVHARTAEVFGVPEATLAALVSNVDDAPVTDRLKPILRYVRTLTLAPTRLTDADAAAVFAVGWTEGALHDAISVACLFNFMNRMLEGHGVHGSEALFDLRGRALAKSGYALMGEQLK